MASQALSASANALKGDPPTRMAVRLRLMGRQEATKPGRPWRPGPLLLSLLITNEKPRSLALHISNSSVAGAMRLKCRAIPRSRPQNGPSPLSSLAWGRILVVGNYSLQRPQHLPDDRENQDRYHRVSGPAADPVHPRTSYSKATPSVGTPVAAAHRSVRRPDRSPARCDLSQRTVFSMS